MATKPPTSQQKELLAAAGGVMNNSHRNTPEKTAGVEAGLTRELGSPFGPGSIRYMMYFNQD